MLHWLKRLAIELARTRPVTWLYLHVFPHIDRVLLRMTGGRFGVSIGQRNLLLITTGAKTGKRRSVPLLYFTDSDRIIVIASNGGRQRHPAWLHNLRAYPNVEVIASKRSGCYKAHETSGEERERLWAKVVGINPGYSTYQARARGRLIPVVALTPHHTPESSEGGCGRVPSEAG